MKLVHYYKEDTVKLGVKTDLGIIELEKLTEATTDDASSFPSTLQELIEQGEAGLARLQTVVNSIDSSDSLTFVDEKDIRFAPAVTNPEKIVCVGLNYISHAEESNMEIPKSPILFSKFNNALAAHEESVKLPEATDQCDYEAELVAIMGKTAQNVTEDEALSYVFGYTTGNDLSARDLQFKSGQWLLGKTSDGFAPVGPYIALANDIDPNHLSIKCEVNGVLRQNSNTENMIFNVATLISYISHHMTLKPGDIIFTGTPEGVILGYPEEKRNWLKSGDEMVVTIEGIGSLRNRLY